MKVFVRYHAFDCMIVIVGGSLRISKHQSAVENIEPFIFHRAHIEIVGTKNHETVKIVLTTVTLLVPAHRPLQRIHGVSATRNIFFCRINLKVNAASGTSYKLVVQNIKIPRHQGKEIARFRKWIFPCGEMTLIVKFALRAQVAV